MIEEPTTGDGDAPPVRLSATARRVRDLLRRERCLEGVRLVVVGFSGGADSTALVLVLRELGIPLVAVHLHHGLRGKAADADAEACRRFCAERGIDFECDALPVRERKRPGESTETAGRRLRREFWSHRAGPECAVALGHHADDRIEDLFLKLARGANAGGLTGLRPCRMLAGVRMIRPLLELRRADIEAYLAERGVDAWREDASNRDTSFRRNAVRHRLLPCVRDIFGTDRGVSRALEALADDADYIESAAREALPAVADRDALRRLHPALLPRVLRLWLQECTGEDPPQTRHVVNRLRRALDAGSDEAVEIPLGNGRGILLDGAGMHLIGDDRGAGIPAALWDWRTRPHYPVPGCGGILRACVAAAPAGREADGGRFREWFALADLTNPLTIRSRLPGDRLIPFGRKHAKKLQDLLVDARVPRSERDSLPVVCHGNRVIWVPGVRRAEFARTVPGCPALLLEFLPAVSDA